MVGKLVHQGSCARLPVDEAVGFLTFPSGAVMEETCGHPSCVCLRVLKQITRGMSQVEGSAYLPVPKIGLICEAHAYGNCLRKAPSTRNS